MSHFLVAEALTMDQIAVLLTFSCCSTAHFVVTAVMALYARYRVKYLSIAWIMGMFSFILGIVAYFSTSVSDGNPGILHPAMMVMLVVGAYLQSIYTLGITMPGFLQWFRMLRYASPIFALVFVYAVAVYPIGSLTLVYTYSELLESFWSMDLFLRFLALLLSVYYLANIAILPRLMSSKTDVPGYILGYCTALGISDLYYIYVSIDYTPIKLCIWTIVFTLLNLYLAFRTLENMASHMPHPDITDGAIEEPGEESDVDQEREVRRLEDFNEMNIKRYHRVQYWMQNNKEEWTDNTFNRDRLCIATGINRQLMLQCLRSQGHNNVHDYLTVYRVEELKRLILRGDVKSVTETDMAGFGTPKTARACFLRVEGLSLDDYIEKIKNENKEEE